MRAFFQVVCALLLTSQAHAFTTVVIDAGHGGKDPGCIWNGLTEKNLCLDVAKRLQSILQGAGMKTVMTRTTDKFVELSGRADISNRQGAAVFVSIHFNASKDRSVSGFEVHYRSKRGLVLATAVQAAMAKTMEGRSRDTDWEDLKVLRETKATAVLVECGFISNKRESQRCAEASHRQAIAQGIARGLLAAKTKL